MNTIANPQVWRCGLPLCLLLGTIGGCSDADLKGLKPQRKSLIVQGSAGNPLLGDWLRVDDSYAGAIVRFEQLDGELVGTLVYPGDGLAEYGFEIGVAKIRDLKKQPSGNYSCRSRSQWTANDCQYYDGVIEAEPKQILLRHSDGSPSQRWVKIKLEEQKNAQLLFGLWVIHTRRDDRNLAGLAASQLVEVRADLKSQELNEIAWELTVAQDPKDRLRHEAVLFAKEACEKGVEAENLWALAFAQGTKANYLDTLAAAEAANGNWEAAVAIQRKACELKGEEFPDNNMWARLVLFQQQKVYHRGVDLSGIDVASVKTEGGDDS